MNSSKKGIIIAFVLLLIAIVYFVPIIPAEFCPSIIGKCASLGEGNMTFPNLVESWIGFFMP
jgi:hypothetical protein